MKKLDTYLSLCTEVYDLSKPYPPEEAYAFYRHYANAADGLILEPMCGTGRFLLPMVEEGFQVHGFDASDHMLAKLRGKAKANNVQPIIWQGFIEELQRPERYNLIFIPSGSFCLIIENDAVKSALKALYDHLSDDGVLLLEVETLEDVPPLDVWHGSVWHKSNGQKIMLSTLTTMKDNCYQTIGKYELIDNNSIIHTEIEELTVRTYDQNECTELVKNCGFKEIHIINAYDGTVVYECRK